jgi:uncharacterized OB-fold protein
VADAYAKSRGGRLSDAFWGALDDGHFTLQRCDGCGLHRFPPISMCPRCHSVDFQWVDVAGRAALWSWTVVHRPPKPEFADAVPYCLGVGQLEEGPLVLARIGAAPLEGDERPAIGTPLRLVVDPKTAGSPPRYHFELDRSGAG